MSAALVPLAQTHQKPPRFDWPALFAKHAECRKQRTAADWSTDDFLACQELVRRGSMRQILTKAQRAFYDAFKSGEYREVALWSGRKMGKSFTLLTLAYEFALNNPGSIILLVLPELKQAKDICFPMVNELEKFIPADLRPVLLRSEGKIRFGNKSEIKLGGSKPENVESLRGPACHLLLLDEVAFFSASNFHNALHNILLPQLTITGGPTLFATTPPRSPDHPFLIDVFPRIQAKNAWFKFTIFDNPLVSADRIQEIAEACGGFESESFLREYMGEVQADSSLRVIPEFTEDTHVLWDDHPREDLFGIPVLDYRGYVTMDTGVIDFTAILCGFYDHDNAQLVVTHEMLFNSSEPNFCTEYCADKYREMERKISSFCQRITGVIDAWPTTALDFRRVHQLDFEHPRKGTNVEANIAFARACFENNKVRIHERCTNLRFQLRTGIWNDAKTDFVKSPLMGHLDLIMALVYMLRAVDWRARPGMDNSLGIRNLGRYTSPKVKANQQAHKRLMPPLWRGEK